MVDYFCDRKINAPRRRTALGSRDTDALANDKTRRQFKTVSATCCRREIKSAMYPVFHDKPWYLLEIA